MSEQEEHFHESITSIASIQISLGHYIYFIKHGADEKLDFACISKNLVLFAWVNVAQIWLQRYIHSFVQGFFFLTMIFVHFSSRKLSVSEGFIQT